MNKFLTLVLVNILSFVCLGAAPNERDYPRSQAEIVKELQRLEKLDLSKQPGGTGPQEALRRLMMYRYLSGIKESTLKLDPKMNDLTQFAAKWCAAAGTLDHHPKDPHGLSADEFKKAQTGCGSSNLSMGKSDLAASVDRYMDI